TSLFISSVDFGNIEVGGHETKMLKLVNVGSDPLSIASVTLDRDNNIFQLIGPSPGAIIRPGASVNVIVAFNPLASSTLDPDPVIKSNVGAAPYLIALTAAARSTNAQIDISTTNNNAGEQKLGSSPKILNQFGMIRNDGSQDLIINGLSASN